MMTPPLSIWARPRLAVQVPVSGAWPLEVGDVGAMGSTVMTTEAPGVWTGYPYIPSVCTDVRQSVSGTGGMRLVPRAPTSSRPTSGAVPVPRAVEPSADEPCRTSAAHRVAFGQMGRAVYVDCFSGASGDMLLGALLDAGVSLDDLRAGLMSLPVSGWSLEAEAARQHGLGGTRAKVRLTQADQPHRGLGEVVRIVRQASLPSAVLDR